MPPIYSCDVHAVRCHQVIAYRQPLAVHHPRRGYRARALSHWRRGHGTVIHDSQHMGYDFDTWYTYSTCLLTVIHDALSLWLMHFIHDTRLTRSTWFTMNTWLTMSTSLTMSTWLTMRTWLTMSTWLVTLTLVQHMALARHVSVTPSWGWWVIFHFSNVLVHFIFVYWISSYFFPSRL